MVVFPVTVSADELVEKVAVADGFLRVWLLLLLLV